MMDNRQPVIWLSGSVAVPKDTSTFVENTSIRVVTVIVSISLSTMEGPLRLSCEDGRI